MFPSAGCLLPEIREELAEIGEDVGGDEPQHEANHDQRHQDAEKPVDHDQREPEQDMAPEAQAERIDALVECKLVEKSDHQINAEASQCDLHVRRPLLAQSLGPFPGHQPS